MKQSIYIPSPIQEIEKYLFNDFQKSLQITKQKGTHSNVAVEEIFRKILNQCYNLNLENLNVIRPNYPVIDLGGIKSQVAAQVSADSKVDNKIRKTVIGFKTKCCPMTKIKFCEQYKKLIIIDLFSKVKSHLEFHEDFEVQILNRNQLYEIIAGSNSQVIRSCLNILRAAKADGLIEDGSFKEQNTHFIPSESLEPGCFRKSLSGVRINVRLPASYNDSFSCVFDFRSKQLSGIPIVLNEDQFDRLYNRQEEIKQSKEYPTEFGISLVLANTSMIVESYIINQVITLINSCYKYKQQAKLDIDNTIGATKFKPFGDIKNYKYEMLIINYGIWKLLLKFARNHDCFEGTSKYHVFGQVSWKGESINLQHGLNSPSEHRGQIRCVLCLEQTVLGGYALCWSPLINQSKEKMEDYDNSFKWKVDYTHDWILYELIPYMFFWEKQQYLSVFEKLIGARQNFEEFKKEFDYRYYGIISCKK